jgi:HlyD family secretion protein
MTTSSARFGILKNPWVIGALVVVIAGAGYGIYQSRIAATTSSTAKSTTVTVTRGDLTTTLSGSSNIAANNAVTLNFQSSGVVKDVLVAVGDPVKKGQILATLDDRELTYAADSAKAARDSATAKLDQLTKGTGRETELSSAQASVRSAEKQLASAQEKLAALQNPSPDKLSAQRLKVDQARTNLQTTRDNASATKTKAQIDLTKASETLVQMQSKFNVARYNWEYVLANDRDPNGARGTISDVSKNNYRDAFVTAESNLRNAEQSVTAAQVTLDNAKSAEIANVAQAEATLADAELQLRTLQNPTASDITAAEASVEQANASLEQARTSLDKIVTPGTASDILMQQAAVTQAESSYQQALLRLENTTLIAPFDGTVSSVNAVTGQASAGANVGLIDRTPLHIDLKLGETDVVNIKLDQKVDIVVDALPDWKATGAVTSIAPAADSSSGVVAYTARIDFTDDDPRVLVGMTATVDTITAQRTGVLLIPNSSILPKGTGRVVQVKNADGSTAEIDITIGLSDGLQTEVLTGLTEGQQIVAAPTGRVTTSSGPAFGRP